MPQVIGLAPDRVNLLFLFEDGVRAPIEDQYANTTPACCHNCLNRFTPARDGGYFCPDHRLWRCHDCGECSFGMYTDANEHHVHPFSFRPHFKPKGNWRATDGFYQEPLMGVELEVGGRPRVISPVVRRVDDSEDHLYMKEDGSITGVEIVTHPMTLEYAREYQFKKLLKGLRKAGSQVDDGYGLHIHVARNAFQVKGKPSNTHQMVWLLFLYRNSSKLEMLARRQANRYATWHKPRPGELARKAKFVGDRSNDSRYVAVNCNNEATFELRFFKATLEEQEFYAALEFADASVRYTRDIPARDVLQGGALTWPHFVGWVENHNYPVLAAELEVREAAVVEAKRVMEAQREMVRARRREQQSAALRAQALRAADFNVYPSWEEAVMAAERLPSSYRYDVFINTTVDGYFYLTRDGSTPLRSEEITGRISNPW